MSRPWDRGITSPIATIFISTGTERAQINGSFENIFTVGMRGLHDSALEGVSTTAQKIAVVEQAFGDQREILANRVNADPTKVPQVVVLYNEVLDLYKAGLRIPDDVTIMWPDDNQGYIRQLSGPVENARSGGSGVYYHLSYWGPPEDYLWLCDDASGRGVVGDEQGLRQRRAEDVDGECRRHQARRTLHAVLSRLLRGSREVP